MSSSVRSGLCVAVLLLASVGLAANAPLPQGKGPAPGAPVATTGSPLPVASPPSATGRPATALPQALGPPSASLDSSVPGGKTSAFALWWAPLRGVLPERLRQVCATYSATREVADWCSRYHGSQATLFDAQALFSSDALVLVAWFNQRPALLEALSALQSALAAVRGTELVASPQLVSARALVDTALSRTTLNAGTEVSTPRTLPLPSLALSTWLEPLFQGLAEALQQRAETEAVMYVLLEFDERICAREVEDTWGQVHGRVRDWLPSTCTAAHNEAFSATLGSGGTASLALLRKTVEEDLRAIPSHLAFEVTSQAEGGKYVRAAPAVRELVDSVMEGTPPIWALDTFSHQLEVLPLEPGLPDDVARTYTRLACVSSMPAAFTRYGTLVDDANEGLVPELDSRSRGLAVLLLSLERESCGVLYAPVAGQSRLKTWAALASPLSESAEGVAQVATELRQLTQEVKKLQASPPGDATQVAEVTQVLAREGAAVLGAMEVALDGVLRLNTLVGAGAENREALLSARRLLSAARDTLRLVVAALQRDLASVYQLLLEHQAVSSKQGRYDPEGADQCAQAQAWKAPAASAPEARTSEWQCERAPCVCLPPGFVRYGGLLVALANAKDAQEVKAIILAASSPVGSWRWRSDPDVHHFVSLGGMVGLGGGYSFTGSPDAGRVTPRLLVPVGVDYQLGRAALTWSVFVQAIDLAGYTRFINQQERTSPRVMEAISPGVWIKGLVPGTPFALTVGGAYDLDAGGLTPSPAWRLTAGLVIDAPLFILYRN